MPHHVLVATNNFWVGGRETYIYSYLKNVSRDGFRASIIASSLMENTPETLTFNEKIVCGTSDYTLRWRNWLQKAHNFIKQKKPSLVWAHHYDLFPAWLISRLYKIPLLTTFHGPLIGVNRPNDPMQALGMTLAIHRGDVISGVSEEIVSGLERLNRGAKKVQLIPNSVELSSTAWKYPGISRPKRFLLITRPEKLEHTRKALLLFDAYRKKVNGCRLTIAGGRSPNDKGIDGRKGVLNLIPKLKFAIKYLGGKWIYEQGPHILLSLCRTNFNGYIANSRDLIQKSDIVLGMGRVLLEGMAEGKPCVLIGYDNICGLISPKTFEQYRWSNFSGRGIKEQAAPEVCDSILDFCKNEKTQNNEHLDLISIHNWSIKFKELIQEIANSSKIEDNEISLARDLSQNIESNKYNSSDLFSFVCSKFNKRELSSLYKLSIG